jgi:hypothetical protein
VFTARYALSPYIKQISSLFKGLNIWRIIRGSKLMANAIQLIKNWKKVSGLLKCTYRSIAYYSYVSHCSYRSRWIVPLGRRRICVEHLWHSAVRSVSWPIGFCSLHNTAVHNIIKLTIFSPTLRYLNYRETIAMWKGQHVFCGGTKYIVVWTATKWPLRIRF